MNRGSLEVALCLGTVDLPSMRPRFMNRGSQIEVEHTRLPLGPFNEAPIHESGKYSKIVCIA